MLLHALLLYLTLAVCGGLFFWLIRRHDLAPREPWPVLALAAVVGALGMWAAGQAQIAAYVPLYDWHQHDISILEFAALAGTTEELAKLFAAAAVLLTFRKFFNEVSDGVVYGSVVGLGAAIEESIALFTRVQQPGLPLTEPVRLFGHLVMGGISCAGLGIVAVRGRRALPWVVLMWVAGAAFHTVWDVIAFSASEAARNPAGVRPWHTIASVLVMFAGYMLYRLGVELSLSADRRRARRPAAA